MQGRVERNERTPRKPCVGGGQRPSSVSAVLRGQTDQGSFLLSEVLESSACCRGLTLDATFGLTIPPPSLFFGRRASSDGTRPWGHNFALLCELPRCDPTKLGQ